MNTNLLNIIKRILADHGENILAEPQRLKPLFSDYAKNEQKEKRTTFGRCIEEEYRVKILELHTEIQTLKKKSA
jgi:hypothetical protein